MRYLTVRIDGGTSAARQEGDELVLLEAADVGEALALVDAGAPLVERGGTLALAEAELSPPVPTPSKILCLGLNYRAHILEMGRELPSDPTLFAKFARALVGPTDPILLPPESTEVDWEGELGIVIGRRVRRARGDEAAAAIGGFTVVNDVSMRDWQWRTQEWLQGKTFERSTPVGPVVVTPEELGGPRPDLVMTVQVDGEEVQRANTGDLVFDPVAIVEYASTIITLDPGDLIATGTPGGVGAARKPPRFLAPGNVVRTEIEGIGVLENRCEADGAG
jgi:acylpyruvate hydrolase